MKKVLITGGAGFIGSHLVEFYLNNNVEVIVLDNFSTGRIENLNQFKDDPNLSIFECDISKDNLENYFDNIDYVFHLAALADIVPSIEDPLSYFNANVVGTLNLMQSIKSSKIKKIIYAASSSCYGIPNQYPTNEDAPINPQYPYAFTKNIGEQLIKHWSKIYNIPYVSLRFFNVYGTRSRTSGTYGAVFGVFLAQKLAKKPFTVVGDGKQKRDFTYVTDVVEAINKSAISVCENEVFNIGSDNTYSINELIALLGGKSNFIPKRPGEPDCTWADISKAKKILDWQPKISLKEGVNKLLENIDYWSNAPVWNEESIAIATKKWFKYIK